MGKQVMNVEVLVVGAGPVGLAMGLDLGWRGINCLVIEREPDRDAAINAHPRAAAVTPRTMEFCRRWGVAQDINNSPFPHDWDMNIVYCLNMQGPTVLVQKLDSLAKRKPSPHSPELRHRCPQAMFDPILENGVSRFPSAQVRRPWQLDSFVDDGAGVVAQITDRKSGVQIEVRAAYMVACDGAISPIRETLGIATEGSGLLSLSLNAILEIPDFLKWHDKGPAERYMFLDHRGVWAELTVVDGRNRWRLGYAGSTSEADRDSVDVHQFIRSVLGPDMPYELVTLAPWKRREQMAAQFRKGRVFLAGDAAHTIPPNLGMGMNTGLGDVMGLGWKLEAALKGWAGEALFDSYQAERKPVAVDVGETSTRTYHRWMTASPDYSDIGAAGAKGESARQRAAAHVEATLPDGWDTLGFQIGYRYDDSPIIIPDGSPKPPPRDGVHLRPFTPTARPGAAAPHFWLADGRSVLDLFGRGFTLLDFGGTGDSAPLAAAAAARGVPFATVRIDDPAAAALYQNSYALIRPDNHVAWRGDALPADPLAVIDRVRGA